MTAPTHVAFAEFVYLLLLTTAGVAVSVANATLIAASSILADIDTGSSIVGRMLPAVSLRIERSFGHRTLTHSALFVAGLAGAALPLASADKDLYACLVVGYATHPILDTMNVGGVKLFYPFARVRCVFPFDVSAPARFRTPTGSAFDRALGALFLAACIPALLISLQGHERFIRLTQQTIASAVRDYNEFSLTRRVVADVRARNLFTKEQIAGRFEIAGALDDRTLLFRDEQGTLHTLGDGFEAEYSTESAACYPMEPVRTVVRTLELGSQTLSSVADACDFGPGTYVFGELVMSEPVEVHTSPAAFTPVSGAGHVLKLRYATPGQLRRADLATLLVASGRLTVRTEIVHGLEIAKGTEEPGSGGSFALVSLRCRRGQELEITASTGDTVRPGQMLARIRQKALTIPRAQIASLELRLAEFRARLRDDSLEISRLQRLSQEGFAAPIRIGQAERSLDESWEQFRAAQQRRALLVETAALRVGADSLRARSDVLRSEIQAVVHDIRHSTRGTVVEVTFILRKELP